MAAETRSAWAPIFANWQAVELDLHQYFGLDLSDDEALHRRSWRWLRVRIVGLLSVDRGPFGDGGSRLQRVLRPVKVSAPKSGADSAEG